VAKLQSGSHVFVSYAHADAEYVLRLTQQFQDQGVPFWFDRERLEPGSEFNREIEGAIESCSCFVLVMTPASKASEYVEEERDLAKSLGKNLVPLLVEGERHFGVFRRNYVDLRDRRLPSADVVERLRSLTRPPTLVAPSYRGAATPNPTQALTLYHGQGPARFVMEATPAGPTVHLVDDQVGQSQCILSCDAAVEQLVLSPDGSLLAVNEGGSLRLAEVGGHGDLSLWELELDLAATFDPSERIALVGLGRSTSRFDPCADLLITDGAEVRRFRVDRAGRWRRSPRVSGPDVVRAAAVSDGYLVLIDGGEILAVGCPLESFVATGTWIDIDAAVGEAPVGGKGLGGSGGLDGHTELVAAVRVEDGDAQLIAWRRLGGEPPEVRGLDLEVDDGGGELRVDVVRPRAGGEPERILVTAGRHTLGWLWDELAPVDPERLAAGGIPT
jgi:hypothetical protein